MKTKITTLIGAVALVVIAALVYVFLHTQMMMSDTAAPADMPTYSKLDRIKMEDMQHDAMNKNRDMTHGAGHIMVDGKHMQMQWEEPQDLTPAERQEIIETIPMPVIGLQKGDCFDSDGDGLSPQFYPAYVQMSGAEKQYDTCSADGTQIMEMYCRSEDLLEGDKTFVADTWVYECEHGCADGKCRLTKKGDEMNMDHGHDGAAMKMGM